MWRVKITPVSHQFLCPLYFFVLCYRLWWIKMNNRRDIKRCFCLTSDVCLSVAYIRPKSRTERPRKTKIGLEVAHVTRDLDTTFKIKRSKVKGQGQQATLLGCTDRPTCPYSNGDLSMCVHDVYRVTTCRPGRGISWRPPARLQLVKCPVAGSCRAS